jgi:hypothetical protein
MTESPHRWYLFSEWPHWARGVVVIIIAVLLALGLLLFLPDAAGEIKHDEVFAKYEERLIFLERQAAEEAYHDQIRHLFLTWAKDETGQPGRALVGAQRARKMYAAVMDALDKREQARPRR